MLMCDVQEEDLAASRALAQDPIDASRSKDLLHYNYLYRNMSGQ